MPSRVTEFLDNAFSYQMGESYPERHQENIARLKTEFPEYETELIDCLYRITIHLGDYSSDLAKKIYHRYLSVEDAKSTLEVIFYHFSKGTLNWALENAIDQYIPKQS